MTLLFIGVGRNKCMLMVTCSYSFSYYFEILFVDKLDVFQKRQRGRGGG